MVNPIKIGKAHFLAVSVKHPPIKRKGKQQDTQNNQHWNIDKEHLKKR